MPMLWKMISRSPCADLVVADEAAAVAGGPLDLQVLEGLADGADVVAQDGVDVGQPAGAEEHLEDHHARCARRRRRRGSAGPRW